LFTLFSCKKKEENELPQKQPFCLDTMLKEKVDIEQLHEQYISEEFRLTGSVTYNNDKIVPFISLVEGVAVNTFFSLGDYVQKGQVLAEIKSAELNVLQSEKKSIESQLLVANRELAAVKSMFDDGIASQKELLSSENEVTVLKASLLNTIENLNLYGASDTKGVFQIKAPYNGYIVTKNISPGMPISSDGDPLFTISDLNEVWVMANIYATNMQNIKENMEVDIETLAYPNEIFSGKITTLSQVFDAEERVLKARIVMKNKDLKLKPGMSADIIIKKHTNKQALAIPANAIIFDDNQHYVLLYQSDCQIQVQKIEPITKNKTWVFVDKNNIPEKAQIITKNQLLIYEQIKKEQNF